MGKGWLGRRRRARRRLRRQLPRLAIRGSRRGDRGSPDCVACRYRAEAATADGRGRRHVRGRSDARRRDADLVHPAVGERSPAREARSQAADRARDGSGAADQPRAEDGRAVVDGEHRRLSLGDRSGQSIRQLLHRSVHGRRQGAARQGPDHRRWRRRPRGARRRQGPRRDRSCVRRAARRRGAGQVARR
jgi:hypothetical protein